MHAHVVSLPDCFLYLTIIICTEMEHSETNIVVPKDTIGEGVFDLVIPTDEILEFILFQSVNIEKLAPLYFEGEYDASKKGSRLTLKRPEASLSHSGSSVCVRWHKIWISEKFQRRIKECVFNSFLNVLPNLKKLLPFCPIKRSNGQLLPIKSIINSLISTIRQSKNRTLRKSETANVNNKLKLAITKSIHYNDEVSVRLLRVVFTDASIWHETLDTYISKISSGKITPSHDTLMYLYHNIAKLINNPSKGDGLFKSLVCGLRKYETTLWDNIDVFSVVNATMVLFDNGLSISFDDLLHITDRPHTQYWLFLLNIDLICAYRVSKRLFDDFKNISYAKGIFDCLNPDIVEKTINNIVLHMPYLLTTENMTDIIFKLLRERRTCIVNKNDWDRIMDVISNCPLNYTDIIIDLNFKSVSYSDIFEYVYQLPKFKDNVDTTKVLISTFWKLTDLQNVRFACDVDTLKSKINKFTASRFSELVDFERIHKSCITKLDLCISMDIYYHGPNCPNPISSRNNEINFSIFNLYLFNPLTYPFSAWLHCYQKGKYTILLPWFKEQRIIDWSDFKKHLYSENNSVPDFLTMWVTIFEMDMNALEEIQGSENERTDIHQTSNASLQRFGRGMRIIPEKCLTDYERYQDNFRLYSPSILD